MGMFSRMSDIVQANINAILDKAEDPQKVIRLIVQEMEETLVELRSVAARSLADKKQLSRKLDKLQGKANDWHAKAELAIEKGREDLARAALAEKHQTENQIGELNSELTQVEEAIAKLQEDTGRLQEKLAEARAKQKSLVMRQQSASVRLKAKTQDHVVKIDDAIARFEQYEGRIDDLESQIEAYDLVKSGNSLDDQFKQLENDEKIEAELAAMKSAKKGKKAA